LKFVLCVTWVDIDYLVTGLRRKLCPEPRTFEKYLMVSKYQKKMYVHYNEVEDRTNSNVRNSGYRDDTDCYGYDEPF
jgi:hypothetical protein